MGNAAQAFNKTLDLVDANVRAFVDQPHKNFIDGTWVEAESGKSLDVFDPSSGEVISSIQDSGPSDVDQAVQAAHRALSNPEWRDMIPARREKLLFDLADLIEKNGEQLAQLETLDNGKLVHFSRAIDVRAGSVAFARYMGGWATKIEGSTFQVSMPEFQQNKFQAYTRREPVGVVAGIVPWNFPLPMAVWKIAPALATGCTVVLKPAEETSLTALRLSELIKEVGIPDGVVNIVTGVGEVAGDALVRHPLVNKINFTGSTEVGKLIGRQAADDVKRVSLELGGKSPAIVFDDANLDEAIVGAANAIFFNQGQVCCAGSRLLVQRSVYDRVVKGVAEIARNMKLDSGLAEGAEMGPLVSVAQYDRVTNYMSIGQEEGAELLVGGTGSDRPGYFVQPTVFASTHREMKIVREEIFGPVLCCTPFDDIDEAVAIANDTEFGLAASVWTQNVGTMHHMIEHVAAGTVWVNCHNLLDPNMPWGGFKQSGHGRELGRTAIDLYTELKSVCVKYK